MAYTNEALGKALEDLTRAYDNFIKNTKDQVVQSLGTEVINEIKQGANAYVSAQIDEKIETKVSAAMTGEEAAFFKKVDTRILTSSNNLKKDVLKRFIDYFENGYIQWPGMPSPLEDTSLHFEGYSWYEVNYDGNFFRAKGRNAKAFSAKRLTKEQIKDGAYIFQDDEQGDAIRNILSKVFSGEDAVMFWGDVRANLGAFQTKNKEGKWKAHFSPAGEEWLAMKYLILDASKADGVTVAEENRSRNLTFTFWVLVKNE